MNVQGRLKMNETMTEKYIVKNIDCANCAAKIENGLKKLGGVDYVSLDFANQTLHVKTSDLDRIIEHKTSLPQRISTFPVYKMRSGQTEKNRPRPGRNLRTQISGLT